MMLIHKAEKEGFAVLHGCVLPDGQTLDFVYKHTRNQDSVRNQSMCLQPAAVLLHHILTQKYCIYLEDKKTIL